jgi:hypothetical protein
MCRGKGEGYSSILFLALFISPPLSIKTQHNPYPHIPCHYNEAKKRETCPEAAAHNYTPATLPYT